MHNVVYSLSATSTHCYFPMSQTPSVVRIRLRGADDIVYLVPRCPIYTVSSSISGPLHTSPNHQSLQGMIAIVCETLTDVLGDASASTIQLVDRDAAAVMTDRAWPLMFDSVHEIEVRHRGTWHTFPDYALTYDACR